MADSRWETVKEAIIDGEGYEDYDGLLNLKDTDTDLPLVNKDDPVNWRKFAQTILGTFIAVFAVGASAIQQAFFEGLAGYPSGIGSFTTDLVTAVLNLPGNLIETAAQTTSTAVETYGILAYVLAVAAVLGGLYITAKVVEVVR